MSEVIYMYRRKGQDAWATCDESRYLELGGSHLFEVRIIHTGNEYAALSTRPQPAAVEAVEVVAYMDENSCLWNGTTHPGRMTQLMTVAQHNRIMASAPQRDAELVELLRDKFPRVDPCKPLPLDEKAHCCEYTIYVERERLHRLIDANLSAKP